MPVPRLKNDLERRLALLKQTVPTRGMERHPQKLKGVSELPAELQSPSLTSICASESIQEIISFPAQIQRGHHYIPKQALLFTETEVIHVLASIWPDEPPEITTLQGSGLLYLQVTLILLYGFLEIAAQGNTSPTRVEVEFNTVAWDQISMPVRKLLQISKYLPIAPANMDANSPSTQQAAKRLPLKFFNGLRIYGILPGEQLEDLVFQYGTWERVLLFFKRAILANSLIILTSNYVVIIREEVGVSQGWIITYIPRKSIASIIYRVGSKWNEVAVQLKQGDQTLEYRIQLTNEATQTLRACWIKSGGEWHDLPDKSDKVH
jgi:hypothetical protein